MSTVRLDRWLCAARIFKSRTQAADACTGGHVKINGITAKPSHALKVTDEVIAHAPRGLVVLEVMKLAEKRLSAALARELYEDHSPPPPPREERVAPRLRGSGRPTKAERRALTRLRGD